MKALLQYRKKQPSGRDKHGYPTGEEWSLWEDICIYISREDAEDSAATFKRINPGREYRILP